MITNLRNTIWGRLKDLASAKVVQLCAAGVPSANTGKNIAGKGSLYTDITAGDIYINKGTILAPSWTKANALSSDVLTQTDARDVATTGMTDFYLFADSNGRLAQVFLVSASALPANASNYVTISVTNLGKSGTGTASMLSPSEANTTKAQPLPAGTPRLLELTPVGNDLLVEKYDRIRIRVAVSGTLPNVVTGVQFALDIAN